MDYRRLLYFVEIVDAGTYTAAADRLLIAQPALSRQMKNLENDLEFELFQREGSHMVLTPAGRKFLPMARRLLSETSNVKRAALSLNRGSTDHLTLAATVTSIYEVVAPFLATLDASAPMTVTRAEPHFEIYNSLSQHADVGVSPAPPAPNLYHRTVGTVPIRAWVDPKHAWAQDQRTEITVEELMPYHVILPSHRSTSRHLVDTALSKAGMTPRRITECDDGATVLALAGAGHGVGISTERSSPHAVALTIYDEKQGNVLELPLHIAWQHNHFAAETLTVLADGLHHFMLEQYALT